MAELKDVLGAVLRDLAQSRVVSDQFSSQVSHEYEKDPILGLFPVPRVEIREASINLKFAVNTVQKRAVDLSAAAGQLSARHAFELTSGVFRDVVEAHPQAGEIVKLIERKDLKLRTRMQEAAEAAALSNPKDLEAARRGEVDGITKRISLKLSSLLLEDADVKRLLLSRGGRVGVIRELVQERTRAAAGRFGAELAAAADALDRQFAIDVGVTRKELAETPEPLVSQISLVAQIRNYEWVEVSEEEGKPVKRLRAE